MESTEESENGDKNKWQYTSWLHRASNNVETFSLPTDAHNVKKHRVIKTF